MPYDHDASASSFAHLKVWLAGFPDQTEGDKAAICQTGEEYVEFHENALARPGDEAVVESVVAGKMKGRIAEYFTGRSGIIYWRVPLETKVDAAEVVLRHDPHGLDEDPVSGKRAVLDRNWRVVVAYCRVYRARCKTLAQAPSS